MKSAIPHIWKNALTCPIPKKQYPKLVNDYRPIDLASIGFNSLQKIIAPFIMRSIDTNGDNCQFAYKRGVSCIDAILTLLHKIVSGLNLNDTTISKVLILDFSSAFNTVLPNYLIHDLCKFIDEPWLIHWIADFIKGWSRQIKLSDGLSEKSDINVGVPQGGPLSALLFTIYTDEIRSNSSCNVIKYANDTIISCNISKRTHIRDQSNYEDFVSQTVSLCDSKNLLLNSIKSKEMVFSNVNIKNEGLLSSKMTKMFIHNSEVERTSQTVYLGLCFDDKLKFTSHISRILKRVYFIVSSLTYIVPYFNRDVRERVFNSNILPHIIYAVPSWYHFLLIKDKKRIVCFLKYCAKMFKLDFTTLISKVNDAAKNDFVRVTTNIFKNEHHPLHTELKSLLKTTSYNLRNKSITPKYRICAYKNSFVYQAALYLQNDTLKQLL